MKNRLLSVLLLTQLSPAQSNAVLRAVQDFVRREAPIHILPNTEAIGCLREVMTSNHVYLYFREGAWREAIRYADELVCSERDWEPRGGGAR